MIWIGQRIRDSSNGCARKHLFRKKQGNPQCLRIIYQSTTSRDGTECNGSGWSNIGTAHEAGTVWNWLECSIWSCIRFSIRGQNEMVNPRNHRPHIRNEKLISIENNRLNVMTKESVEQFLEQSQQKICARILGDTTRNTPLSLWVSSGRGKDVQEYSCGVAGNAENERICSLND